MDHEQENKIASCITKDLIYRTLKKGSLLSGCGALLTILFGSFAPLEVIKLVGIPVFLVGIFLIALGLAPYRKLQRLVLKPHYLVDYGLFFLFLKSGKPLLHIPKESIEKICFKQDENLYGCAINLKPMLEQKIKILQPKFIFETFQNQSLLVFECDLFLPYFQEKDLAKIGVFKDPPESDRAS